MRMEFGFVYHLIIFVVVNGENACDVCRCTTDVVVCTDQGLTAIPDRIPLSTITLLLDRNNLKSIPDMIFTNLTKLQYLDLSTNKIKGMSSRSFHGLNNLEELKLTSNDLMNNPKIFSEHVFSSLQKLKVLWLNNNYGNYDPPKDATYPDEALRQLRMLEELHIDGLQCQFGPGFKHLSRLRTLSMSDDTTSCVMHELKNLTFQNVPQITHLNISNCQILDTEPSTFLPLKSIFDVDLSGNDRLGFEGVAKSLHGLSDTPLRILRLNKLYSMPNFCSKLTYELVKTLGNTDLTELYLDSNGMIDFEWKAVKYLPKTLEVLSLKDNRFIFSASWVEVAFMPSLRYIDLSDLNKWHEIKRDVSSLNNKNRVQLPIPFPFPPKLETVVCSRCFFRGGVFSAIVFNNSLKRIQVDHSLLSFVDGAIHGLNELEYIDLSDNILQSVTIDALSDFPSLKFLNLSHNVIGQILSNDTMGDFFGKLNILEILNISDNKISVLPHVVFRGLKDVQIVDLSHNELEDFDVDITHLKSLQLLDLADNKIRYLSSKVGKSLNNASLNLKLNPISCTCESLDFLKWMAARKPLIQDLNKTQCTYLNGTNLNLLFMDNILNILEINCADFKDVFLISLCIFLSIIFIMTSLIMYRFRWRLRRLYYLGPKGPRRNLDRSPVNYVYDAFVAYADEDRSFVIGNLIAELERNQGLKLCIHDRDFIPGTVIASNIVNAIKNSRKTIIVLSPSFLLSDWCNYELNIAVTEGVARRKNVILGLMYRSVDFNEMPENMSAVFIKYSFLKYNIGFDNQIFWNNVCDGVTTLEPE